MSEIVKDGDVVTIIPDGDIVSDKVQSLREDIDSVIDSFGTVRVDLKSVGLLDSSGIGVLISTQNKLSKSSGELKIINTPDDIYKMFSIMRLNKHFDVTC